MFEKRRPPVRHAGTQILQVHQVFEKIWTDYIAPMLGRPPRFQVAALCYRIRSDLPEVLMITSLTTKRWILPKGWPKDGFDAEGTALEEAWEEAGIRPKPDAVPRYVGRYRYAKRLRGGLPVATDVDVYAIEVESLKDSYPEAERRERRWMTPDEAADLVAEPQLKSILRDFSADRELLKQG